MAKDGVVSGGGRVSRYLIGGSVLALAVFGVVSGAPWGISLTLATAGPMIMAGHRIFTPAITREPGAVVCHYEPWQETGAFIALIAVPLIGIGCIGVAFQSNSPFYGWGGVFLLAITPLSLFTFRRARRRCLLRITPAALSVPRPDDGYTVVDIPRAAVQSITPSTATVGLGTQIPQTEIRYVTTGSGGGTVLLGPAPSRDTVWLTIDPGNLFTAIQVWKDGDPNDPRLLDRIEAALRYDAAPPPAEDLYSEPVTLSVKLNETAPQSFSLGYRPGDPLRQAAAFLISAPKREPRLELAMTAFYDLNDPASPPEWVREYRAAGNRNFGVGDVIAVGEDAWALGKTGWAPVTLQSTNPKLRLRRTPDGESKGTPR